MRFERRVAWGECDPAGIAYTPNILGFAMEAVEQWFAAVVGQSWHDFRVARGLLTPMVHVDLDCAAPIRPGETIALDLTLEKIGRSTLHFTIVGTREGVLLFRVAIVSCFVIETVGRAVSIPEDIRRTMSAWVIST